MSFASFLLPFVLAAAPAPANPTSDAAVAASLAAPIGGAPVVTMKAPPAFVTGLPYEVELELLAPEGGATIGAWMLSPAALTVDGAPFPVARGQGSLDVPAGFTVRGKLDLAKVAGFEPKRDFELGLSKELSIAAPTKVAYVEGAPAGLDFMNMPVEELANWNVLMITTSGPMRFELWPNVAPGHVRNWLDLAYTGFYDGVKFHRCIKGFMIQGGDPNTKDKDPSTWGQGNGPRMLKSEFSKTVKHVRGVLSMARQGHPNYARDPDNDPKKDTASCQFFVCHAEAASLDGGYTAFGKLLEGYDALDKIANAPGTQNPGVGGGIRPNPPQVIQRALVVKAAPRQANSANQEGSK
ncbi:MAG: peptidylprolyl isomerase [Planctomycetes bacterium]|nr:peptidylprolyl isomerase [Planctomycetota bacterium]